MPILAFATFRIVAAQDAVVPAGVQVVADDNGRFDSADLVLAFRAGEYEDEIAGNTTLEEGDWNGDGDFDMSDLLFAFQHGNYNSR